MKTRTAPLLASLSIFVALLPLAALAQRPAPRPGASPSGGYFTGEIVYEMRHAGPYLDTLRRYTPSNRPLALPTALQMKFAPGRFLARTHGGGARPQTLLFLADSGRTYKLDSAGRRALRMPNRRQAPPAAATTQDSIQILGYWARAYTVRPNDSTTLTLWCSPRLRVATAPYAGKEDLAQAQFLIKNLNGMLPLRMVRQSPGLTVGTQALRVSPGSGAPALAKNWRVVRPRRKRQ